MIKETAPSEPKVLDYKPTPGGWAWCWPSEYPAEVTARSW
jgi:hypothetical protein